MCVRGSPLDLLRAESVLRATSRTHRIIFRLHIRSPAGGSAAVLASGAATETRVLHVLPTCGFASHAFNAPPQHYLTLMSIPGVSVQDLCKYEKRLTSGCETLPVRGGVIEWRTSDEGYRRALNMMIYICWELASIQHLTVNASDNKTNNLLCICKHGHEDVSHLGARRYGHREQETGANSNGVHATSVRLLTRPISELNCRCSRP